MGLVGGDSEFPVTRTATKLMYDFTKNISTVISAVFL